MSCYPFSTNPWQWGTNNGFVEALWKAAAQCQLTPPAQANPTLYFAAALNEGMHIATNDLTELTNGISFDQLLQSQPGILGTPGTSGISGKSRRRRPFARRKAARQFRNALRDPTTRKRYTTRLQKRLSHTTLQLPSTDTPKHPRINQNAYRNLSTRSPSPQGNAEDSEAEWYAGRIVTEGEPRGDVIARLAAVRNSRFADAELDIQSAVAAHPRFVDYFIQRMNGLGKKEK